MLKSKRLLVLIVVLICSLFLAAAVFAVSTTVNATGTISTSQTASGRIFRDGIPSDCGGKSYPGPFNVGTPYGYTVEGLFGPVLTDSCITVTWDPQLCSTNAHPVAFKDSFDPAWGASDATNYLGDAGSSVAGTFSFPVSAGDSFVIVFMNTSALASCDYTYSFTYDAGAPSSGGCTLPVPEGSVVGDTPYSAQVYWAPGKVSPGVFLNPGTYIIIGQDESETYYKAVLACQYVWVLKSDMQPSYLPPQNGAPLPTRIVDVSPENNISSGSINDVGG